MSDKELEEKILKAIDEAFQELTIQIHREFDYYGGDDIRVSLYYKDKQIDWAKT